jgi:hypothetical protein
VIISDETLWKEGLTIAKRLYRGQVICGSRFCTELSKRATLSSGVLLNRIARFDSKLPLDKEADRNDAWGKPLLKVIFLNVSLSNRKVMTRVTKKEN